MTVPPSSDVLYLSIDTYQKCMLWYVMLFVDFFSYTCPLSNLHKQPTYMKLIPLYRPLFTLTLTSFLNCTSLSALSGTLYIVRTNIGWIRKHTHTVIQRNIIYSGNYFHINPSPAFNIVLSISLHLLCHLCLLHIMQHHNLAL